MRPERTPYPLQGSAPQERRSLRGGPKPVHRGDALALAGHESRDRYWGFGVNKSLPTERWCSGTPPSLPRKMVCQPTSSGPVEPQPLRYKPVRMCRAYYPRGCGGSVAEHGNWRRSRLFRMHTKLVLAREHAEGVVEHLCMRPIRSRRVCHRSSHVHGSLTISASSCREHSARATGNSGRLSGR